MKYLVTDGNRQFPVIADSREEAGRIYKALSLTDSNMVKVQRNYASYREELNDELDRMIKNYPMRTNHIPVRQEVKAHPVLRYILSFTVRLIGALAFMTLMLSGSIVENLF